MTATPRKLRKGFLEPKAPPLCEHLRTLEIFMKAMKLEFFLEEVHGSARLGTACDQCGRNLVVETYPPGKRS